MERAGGGSEEGTVTRPRKLARVCMLQNNNNKNSEKTAIAIQTTDSHKDRGDGKGGAWTVFTEREKEYHEQAVAHQCGIKNKHYPTHTHIHTESWLDRGLLCCGKNTRLT